MNAMMWLVINLVALFFNAAYSMLEMASISLDKVRLQYRASQGHKGAQQLTELLQNPARLFGTTLIGVNIALVIGSEAARQCVASLGFSPNLAAIPQILVVILLGELAPLFAARKYPEQVVMAGIPYIYLSSKILQPILFITEQISSLVSKLLGSKGKIEDLSLGREDLQKYLEQTPSPQLQETVKTLFEIGQKNVQELIRTLPKSITFHSQNTVEELRKKTHGPHAFYALTKKHAPDIIGIVYPRDLLKAHPNTKLHNLSKQPWFINQHLPILELLKLFRTNHETLSFVIDDQGKLLGYITLDLLLEEIFGHIKPNQHPTVFIERTFDISTSIEDIEHSLHTSLQLEHIETLEQLVQSHLGEHPEPLDSFIHGPFKYTILNSSLLHPLTVKIQSIDPS